MKKTLLTLFSVLLTLCCFIGCENPANSGGDTTDNTDDTNNTQTETPWWVGTWECSFDGEEIIEGINEVGTYKWFLEISNDLTYNLYIIYNNKYVIEERDRFDELLYCTYSNQKQSNYSNIFKLLASNDVFTFENSTNSIIDNVVTHYDRTTSTFDAIIYEHEFRIGFNKNTPDKITIIDWTSSLNNITMSKSKDTLTSISDKEYSPWWVGTWESSFDGEEIIDGINEVGTYKCFLEISNDLTYNLYIIYNNKYLIEVRDRFDEFLYYTYSNEKKAAVFGTFDLMTEDLSWVPSISDKTMTHHDKTTSTFDAIIISLEYELPIGFNKNTPDKITIIDWGSKSDNIIFNKVE